MNSRFSLLFVLLIVLSCNPPESVDAQSQLFELEEKSVKELQELMTSGTYTAVQITQLYIDRIKKVDQGDQGLNAVIELNPEALKIAEQLDNERRDGNIRGPLHGIPVMIKDNIDTGDQMETTAGSMALIGSGVADDAFIVKKLRASGAVLLGKTNLSEWANFRSTRSSSGWSGRGRQTNNPYALDRNPCGSSSGSGVAVSANLCAITIGTETDGSIVCPSTSNGVVGIKPTVGLWSRTGIIPISDTQDTAGPMGRTVADAAALLGPLTGVDDTDQKTVPSLGKGYVDYTQFLNKDGLKGKRIGVLRSKFGFHEKVDSVMELAIQAIITAGAVIVDSVEIASLNQAGNSEWEVLQYEFKDGLNKYLGKLAPGFPIKTLEDVIAFNEENRETEMPYFEQEILISSQKKGDLTEQAYLDALEKSVRLAREEGIDKALKAYKLDAIVAPTGGPAWVTDRVNGDHYTGGSSSLAARAGYPNITVPAGMVNGLPVGISIFSTAWTEPELIAMAYAYEQQTKARVVPQFKPTLNQQ